MMTIRTGSILCYGHNMKRIETYIGIALLLFAVGFNLWTYRLEPTALGDPNDNTFQFALVDRTNQIWDFADKICSPIPGIKAPQFREWIIKPFCILTYLVDHWVPNWAEGYNLPYYYSHIPQIIIVATWRLFSLFSSQYSLFMHYHWVIYFLLSLFPISVFIALQTVGISAVAAGIGALIASHLSTDGLYGLDPSSFLWRGYGLSSQLFAVVWLPLALAYAWNYLKNNTNKRPLVLAILFLAATTSGHLGIGIIAFMSVGIFAISPFIQTILSHTWDNRPSIQVLESMKKMLLVFGGTGLLLAYWIVPILIGGNYHNISVWDGIWKFDSFGYRDVLTNLFNGDLFDFRRFPILTTLVFVGFFSALQSRIYDLRSMMYENNGIHNSSIINHKSYFSFAFLFIFWILLYFGRTTWGGLFTLIPGMSEYHLSRFIVGIHISGLFLIPISIDWIMSRVSLLFPSPRRRSISVLLGIASAILLTVSIYPQTIRYANHNDFLIARGNTEYQKNAGDIDALIAILRAKIQGSPGRVFAGRGGSWGKGFRIAETPMYMHLSTYGIPVILWLPETWSPNSDTEQYFSENNPAHYALYNVRYVATPIDLAPDQIQPFWKLLTSGKTWKLYEVVTDGYITSGMRPAIVSSSKTDYRSVVRLWMHSDAFSQGLFPQLTFDRDYPKQTGLPNFRMHDEATYKVPARNASQSDAGGPDGSMHNLFTEPPLYLPPGIETAQQFKELKREQYADVTVTSQSEQENMVFKATVTAADHCIECIVVLKQSFHPSWKATVDGKSAETFAVFPFYTAVRLDTPGTHEVVFSYEPSVLKKLLIIVALLCLVSLFWLGRHTLPAMLRNALQAGNLQKFKA